MTWKTHNINDGQPVTDDSIVGVLTRKGAFYDSKFGADILARNVNWTEDNDDLVIAYKYKGLFY